MQIATLAFILCCVLVAGQDFGYGGQHGPEHWAENYKRCSGKFQSPIDIDVLSVEVKEFPDIEYTNIDVTPNRVHMANNGHTVLVTMNFEKGREPRIKGGPLARNSSYQFEQFHFHWGANDTVGSEDLVNDRAFPAELHVVIRSLDYEDFKSALGQDHGLAVLAFFFKLSSDDNGDYAEFVEKLSTISRKGMSADLETPLPLSSFISMNLINFYSYNGSLTTPPCAEKVIWIDYQEPIYISEQQLNKFRELTARDDHLKNNYRPPQPINDRIIYENAPPIPSYAKVGYSAIPFVDVANAAYTNLCFGGKGKVFLLATFVINSLHLCSQY
ncbi:carbonic anhydrase 1-like isoform X2 [Drosophila sulfurigaster albostrigata]|uniref:carbonic anhydrase 1-like isoform X2 n=1 Tax=Drosophila sulfurigaster albostrigata TaxID=89887 RepID=UPI002D21A8B1|nr:carbonic anhydrase 1-like isoform X2 [Drosophila sulfurigaster albostrigata]